MSTTNEMKKVEVKALCEDIRSGNFVKAGSRFNHIVDSIVESKLKEAEKAVVDKATKKGEPEEEDPREPKDGSKEAVNETVKKSGPFINLSGKGGTIRFMKSGSFLMIDPDTTGEMFAFPTQKIEKEFGFRSVDYWDTQPMCTHEDNIFAVTVHDFDEIEVIVGKKGKKSKMVVVNLDSYMDLLKAIAGSKLTKRDIINAFEE